MRTEVYKMSPDETYLRRGRREVMIVAIYSYNLLAPRGNGADGYRVDKVCGKTLGVFKLKKDALAFAKQYLKGVEQNG